MSSQRPTKMQRAVLDFISGHGGSVKLSEIPGSVAWYASDTLRRMMRRGWLDVEAHPYDPTYNLTDAGRAALKEIA